MAIPVSTVPAAFAALLAQVQTQIDTDPEAGEILLIEGEEGMDRPNDIVIVGTDVRRNVSWYDFIGSADTGALQEEYEIDLLVSCWSGDPDPSLTRARAWQLVGYVETAVRTDPSLGGLITVAQPSATHGGHVTWSGEPIGRLCEITVSIRCTTLN